MRAALACLAISAVAALGGYLLLQRETERPSAVVTSDSVDANSGPGGAASVLFTLHQGTSVRQLGTEGDWVLVALPNGLSGWVQTDAVQLVTGELPRP